MAATFSWTVKCLCDKPAEYHCNTCGDTLCAVCKAIHLKSKATGHHAVVPYTEKLVPEKNSYPLCSTHKSQECTMWCAKCSKEACTQCATSTHQSHKFVELETILKEKKALMQNELQNLQSDDLKKWETQLFEARKITSDYLDAVKAIDKELDERASNFHNKVDEILQKNKKKLQDRKKYHLSILQQYEKAVSDGLGQTKQEIKQYEDMLRESDVGSLLDYEEDQRRSRGRLPKLSSLSLPRFVSSEIDTQCLAAMFGRFSVEQTNQISVGCRRPPIHPKPVVQQKPSKFGSSSTAISKSLISRPSVKSTFDTGYSYPSIVCVEAGQALVRTDGKTLKVVNDLGTMTDTIRTDSNFNDVALSPLGDILISDRSSKCIKSVSRAKEVKTLFQTDCAPFAICCLSNGDTVVIFLSEGRVVIYNRSGKILEELDKTKFKRPYGAAVNKVNNDLYIIDKEGEFGDSPGKVLTLDVTYKQRFEYSGPDTKGLYPSDICTDNSGHVLITDLGNHRVHILDRDGQFIQFLLTAEQGMCHPYSIDVDSKGNAWVGELKGKVKIVQYLQYEITSVTG